MLVTVQEIRDYLSVNSTEDKGSNANLGVLANYATAVIESYCGRQFDSAFVIEYHDGGRGSVFVDRLPVNNVNAVSEWNGNTYQAVQANDFVNPNTKVLWDSETGEFSRQLATPELKLSQLTFPQVKKGVKVEFNGGYDAIPQDLKLATLDFVKMLHKQESGSQSFTFQGESLTLNPLPSNFPSHIKRVLDFYRVI